MALGIRTDFSLAPPGASRGRPPPRFEIFFFFFFHDVAPAGVLHENLQYSRRKNVALALQVRLDPHRLGDVPRLSFGSAGSARP